MKKRKANMLQKPKLPEKLDFSTIHGYKAALRRYDEERIAAGVVTAEAVQRENDWIKASGDVEVLRFLEAELA